jgi:hypothetical protein
VGFLVDKVALGQIFSKYLNFPCYFSFHQMLHFSRLSSGMCTIGHLQPKYEETQSHPTLKLQKKKFYYSLCGQLLRDFVMMMACTFNVYFQFYDQFQNISCVSSVRKPVAAGPLHQLAN